MIYFQKKLTHLLLWIVITIPVAHVGRFPLFGDVTRVVLLLPVWNNFPSLEKCLWRINKRHQFLGPFAFLWFTTPTIQRFPEHRHFFWAAACLNRTLERMFQCSWNHRCLSGFPIWLHNLIKAHGTSWLFRLDPIHRKHIQEMKLRWEKSSRFH